MFLGKCQTLDLSDGRSVLSAHMEHLHGLGYKIKPYLLLLHTQPSEVTVLT